MSTLWVSSNLLAPLSAGADHEFYCGLITGISHTYGKRTEKSTSGLSLNDNKSFGKTVPCCGLMAGYLHKFHNNFVIGLEPSLIYESFSMTSSTGVVSDIVRDMTLKSYSNMTIDLVARFGRVICEHWLAYGLAGIESKDIQYEVTAVDTSGPDTYKGSCSKRIYGFVYGLGLEKSIAESWRLGFEVRHTLFNSFELAPSMDNYSKLNSTLKSIRASFRLTYAF